MTDYDQMAHIMTGWMHKEETYDRDQVVRMFTSQGEPEPDELELAKAMAQHGWAYRRGRYGSKDRRAAWRFFKNGVAESAQDGRLASRAPGRPRMEDRIAALEVRIKALENRPLDNLSSQA